MAFITNTILWYLSDFCLLLFNLINFSCMAIPLKDFNLTGLLSSHVNMDDDIFYVCCMFNNNNKFVSFW